MMIMNITPPVAPTTAFAPTVSPKSGYIFRPVVQTAIGTLKPVHLENEDLTSFLYPSLPLSQAPLTIGLDAKWDKVILTGEDAYRGMTIDKIEAQASNQGSFSKVDHNTLFMAEISRATNYSKKAQLLDLTPVLDEPLAFTLDTKTFIPAPEKAKAAARQAELLKLQDDKLKGLRQQNVLIETSLTQDPVSAKEVLSLSEARALVAEEQKTLPPVKTLVPKLEAEHWKSLFLTSTANLKEANTVDLSDSQTITFSIEAF